jgi:hypothetical protein
MNISVNHLLPIDEAKKRIQNLAEELKNQYGDQLKDYSETWNENKVFVAFKAMGVKLNGVLEIFPDKVTMNGKVPLMFKMFEKEATKKIKETLENLLK